MKGIRIVLTVALLLFVGGLRAQSISHIETTRNWYYVYNQDGKRIRTISANQGELKGYSSSFYIILQGRSFYITYDATGKRLHTFSVSNVGEILACSGDTFTSRKGAFIYTWSKDGKRISTRAAR